jgi:hypothetical protein
MNLTSWKKILLVLMLLFLMSFPLMAATSKDPSVTDYQTYLSGLDKKNPESVSKAVDYFKSHFDSQKPETVRDDAFQAFRSFYYAALEAYGDVFGSNDRLQRVLAQEKASAGKEAREIRSRLARNGMAILMSEGTYYIGEDSEFLTERFTRCVSQAFDEFLKLRKKELKEGFSEDAGLRISWDSLGDRIASWDGYLSKFPKSVMKNQADYFRRLYLSTFFTGMDNSRVFDSKGVLEPEVKKAYASYIKKYPHSESAALIGRYMQILAKNKGRSSKEAEQFLKEHKIGSMLGVQPPTQ